MTGYISDEKIGEMWYEFGPFLIEKTVHVSTVLIKAVQGNLQCFYHIGKPTELRK